ncbi:hypothetical protein C9701_002940 [Salmonella enterica subsp. arizonae serovar 40:z4,z24:]|nr:hypothetical protein [Salmonella enterica subsp. arizonae serovar 40:z4,z24:]
MIDCNQKIEIITKTDQVVMSFDAFVSYFRKKGWIVAPRDEVAKGIMGAIQVFS